MPDVTLVLKANNSAHIASMKQAQAETQKVYDIAEKGSTKQKGLIEKEIQMQSQLSQSRLKATNFENIKIYNGLLEDSKKRLNEMEQAGVQATTKIEKSGNTLLRSIGEWAAGLIVFSAAMRALKETVAATESGFQALNKIGVIWKTILSEITSGNYLTFKSVASDINMAINAMKEMDKERILQRTELVEIAKAQTTYNELYFAAMDQTKTDAARLQVINQAMLEHEVIIEKKITNAKHELANVRLLLAIPTKNPNRTWLDEEAALLVKLENLEGDRFQETKRLESLRTGIIQSEIDKQKAAAEKARQAEGDANKEYYLQSRDDFFNFIDALNKKKEDDWNSGTDLAKGLFSTNQKTGQVAWDLMLKNEKDLKDAEDAVTKAKQENLAKAGAAVLDYIKIIDELAQREIDAAQRKRELLDTQISETQSALQTEADLQKAGFASNVDAERVKLAALKVQRDKALKDEEIARKKEHTLKVAQLLAEQALSIAKVIMASEIAAAEARIMINNPITAIPGVALLAATRIGEAISIAAITASIIAASLSKFAKGGWTGNGSYRDETGERVAGVVHENEFVVKRGQAGRYRPLLDAINRDDKRMIFNSFNRLRPELLGGTTNVFVENEGPNNRLDQLITENKKLNAKLSGESIQNFGNVQVIRKGNSVRTIR